MHGACAVHFFGGQSQLVAIHLPGQIHALAVQVHDAFAAGFQLNGGFPFIEHLAQGLPIQDLHLVAHILAQVGVGFIPAAAAAGGEGQQHGRSHQYRQNFLHVSLPLHSGEGESWGF